MRLLLSTAALAFTLTLPACSVNPVTGEKEFTLMSASQEVSLGEQKYGPTQQQQGGRYVVDPDLNVYVNRVGQELAKISQRPDLPYEFVVLNNGTPNAWALPGGKIAVNRGLLMLLDDEAQLAAVLGHEIVHAAARHAARQMTQAAMVNVGLQAAGLAAQKAEYGQWILAGAGMGANAWQAHYGRDQELEADRYGVQYLLNAGYDGEAAVELQEKLVALSEGKQQGWMAALFASHPPSQERVERNRKLVAEQPGGDRNTAAFKRAVAQLMRDKPAYEAHTQAVAAANEGDIPAAMQAIREAIKKQPNEALFHITLAQLQMGQKQDAAALLEFKKAKDLNPEYYMGHLGMGLILKRQAQFPAATAALEVSMKFLPTVLAGYHLGELSLTRGDKDKARSYFEFAAQGEGEIAVAAREQLNRLVEAAPAATSPAPAK